MSEEMGDLFGDVEISWEEPRRPARRQPRDSAQGAIFDWQSAAEPRPEGSGLYDWDGEPSQAPGRGNLRRLTRDPEAPPRPARRRASASEREERADPQSPAAPREEHVDARPPVERPPRRREQRPRRSPPPAQRSRERTPPRRERAERTRRRVDRSREQADARRARAERKRSERARVRDERARTRADQVRVREQRKRDRSARRTRTVVATVPATPLVETVRARPSTAPRRSGARRVLFPAALAVTGIAAVALVAGVSSNDHPFVPSLGVPARGTPARAAAPSRHETAVRRRRAGRMLARAEAQLSVTPATDLRTADRGLAAAVRAKRVTAVAALGYREALAQAGTGLPRLAASEAAALGTVLHDVAAQATMYDGPRTLALFGMLSVNARYLAGHPLPASGKLDISGPDGVVYRYRAGEGFQFHPIASFSRLNRLLAERRGTAAARLARAMVARGVPGSGGIVWEYYFPFQGPARWTSGFAQAVGAQGIARAAAMVGDQRLMAAAHAAYAPIPVRFAHPLGGGMWIREYGFSDIPILNSQLQALLSVGEYAKVAHDTRAAAFAAQLATASRNLLPQFSLGCWARYSLGGHPASADYQKYHLVLLKKLAATRPEPIWGEFLRRWSVPCSPPAGA